LAIVSHTNHEKVTALGCKIQQPEMSRVNNIKISPDKNDTPTISRTRLHLSDNFRQIKANGSRKRIHGYAKKEIRREIQCVF
jgi:hypothetical protein